MANTIIPAAEVGHFIWSIFEKCCDEQGLNEKQRTEVLDAFSAQMFVSNSMPKERKNG